MNYDCPCHRPPPEPVMISVPMESYAEAQRQAAGAVQQLNDWRAFVVAMLPDLPSEDMRKAFKQVFGIAEPDRNQWGFR